MLVHYRARFATVAQPAFSLQSQVYNGARFTTVAMPEVSLSETSKLFTLHGGEGNRSRCLSPGNATTQIESTVYKEVKAQL